MKKQLLLLTIAGGLALAAPAQEKEKSITPPAAAKAAFEKAYPGLAAKWEKEDGAYEASFTDKGQKMSAIYDGKGVLKETEVSIRASELPAGVAEYVKQHYKGSSIKEAAKITKANGTVNYEAEVNKKDVIFDAKGVFIKEEKD